MWLSQCLIEVDVQRHLPVSVERQVRRREGPRMFQKMVFGQFEYRPTASQTNMLVVRNTGNRQENRTSESKKHVLIDRLRGKTSNHAVGRSQAEVLEKRDGPYGRRLLTPY